MIRAHCVTSAIGSLLSSLTFVAISSAQAAAPPATSLDDRLGKLKGELTGWFKEVQKQGETAKSPAENAEAIANEKLIAKALQAIDVARPELRQPKNQRSAAKFKKLNTALAALKDAAFQRDLKNTPAGPAPAAPSPAPAPAPAPAAAAAPAAAPANQTLEELDAVTSDVLDAAPEAPPAAPTPRSVKLQGGGEFSYGLTASLLRYSVARLADEPARNRNYSSKWEALPPEFGFQFTYHPTGAPWRMRTASKEDYQAFSVGGILLARVDTSIPSQGELGIAATFQILEDSLGIGVGFDLYRGVPVRGADGERGTGTASTGLLGWALSRDGEITPENVFVVLSLNLAGLAGKIGKGTEQ